MADRFVESYMKDVFSTGTKKYRKKRLGSLIRGANVHTTRPEAGQLKNTRDARRLFRVACRMVRFKRMLRPLSVDDSLRLRGWFEKAGYTEVNLPGYLGAAELPSAQLRNKARLLDRTREVTLLNTLLRWFWLGRPQSADALHQLSAGRASSLADGIRFVEARRNPADGNGHAAAGAKLSGSLRSSGIDCWRRLGNGAVAEPHQQIPGQIRSQASLARDP